MTTQQRAWWSHLAALLDALSHTKQRLTRQGIIKAIEDHLQSYA